jgi:hypothetical protein
MLLTSSSVLTVYWHVHDVPAAVSITCNLLPSVQTKIQLMPLASFISLCSSVESTPFYLIFLFWLPFRRVSK